MAGRLQTRPRRAVGRTILLACRARQQPGRAEAAGGVLSLKSSRSGGLGKTKRELKDLNSRRQRRPDAAKAKINHVIKTGRGRGPRLGVWGSEEAAKVRAEASKRLGKGVRPPRPSAEELRASLEQIAIDSRWAGKSRLGVLSQAGS